MHPRTIADGVPGVFDTGGPTVLRVMAPLRFAPWGVVIEQPASEAFTGPATIRASQDSTMAAAICRLVMPRHPSPLGVGLPPPWAAGPAAAQGHG